MANKQFTRFELNPIATVPGFVGVEIKPAGDERYLYTLIPLNVWQDEAKLMDFIATCWQEVSHE